MLASRSCLVRLRILSVGPSRRLARAERLAREGLYARAFPLFASAARAGLPDARYRVGHSYLMGHGVPPSIGAALRWLERAARDGQVDAQTRLAALALQGIGGAMDGGLFDTSSRVEDYDRAEFWSREAVAAGSAEAKALLGFILTDGPSDRRDIAAGTALYRQAAEAGWAGGQLGLAMILLRQGTTDDVVRARELLVRAAAGGLAVAHHLLGMLAESGLAGPVDFSAAAACYRCAADLGHVAAQVRYGFALLHGRGVDRDAFVAETWLRRAAMAGDAQAAAVVGYLYARHGDEGGNLAEAALWLRRAAEAGHVAAAHALGRLLLQRPSDRAEAITWLLHAARSGDEAARDDTIRLALTRQLGFVDENVVVRWLQQAAAADDPTAQFQFGLCLMQGIGVEQDAVAGLGWVIRAAAGGQAEAMLMLPAVGAPVS